MTVALSLPAAGTGIREVAQGVQYQTADERVIYTITTTNWISSPTSPAVVAYKESDNSVVTGTLFPTNSPSPSGDVITLSLCKDMTKGNGYRVEVQWTVSTEIYESFIRIKCMY